MKGISTVYGNSNIDKVTENALRVLRMGGISNIPVFKGMHQPILRRKRSDDHFHGESGIDGCELPDTDQKAITEDIFYKIY